MSQSSVYLCFGTPRLSVRMQSTHGMHVPLSGIRYVPHAFTLDILILRFTHKIELTKPNPQTYSSSSVSYICDVCRHLRPWLPSILIWPYSINMFSRPTKSTPQIEKRAAQKRLFDAHTAHEQVRFVHNHSRHLFSCLIHSFDAISIEPSLHTKKHS